MPVNELVALILWPIGFGLMGFIEPCAIGSTLLFIKTTEGNTPSVKTGQVLIFTLSRALFTGLLGVAAAFIGSLFLGAQKLVWVAVGMLYIVIGVLYLTGKIAPLMVSFGPRLALLARPRGSLVLGAVLGLNIPACAGPLLLALLASSAAAGSSGTALAHGFVSLALFGFALSLPLVVAVLFAPARRALDWVAGLTRRIPTWTGLLFVVLGIWSVWFGLYVSIQ